LKLHPQLDLTRLPPLAAVVLALKPQVIKGEGKLARALGETGALTLSIAAGITTGYLAAALGSRGRIVRAMPNTPGSIGKGITALYSAPGLSAADRALAATAPAPLGTTLRPRVEGPLHVVAAVSGTGPANAVL